MAAPQLDVASVLTCFGRLGPLSSWGDHVSSHLGFIFLLFSFLVFLQMPPSCGVVCWPSFLSWAWTISVCVAVCMLAVVVFCIFGMGGLQRA